MRNSPKLSVLISVAIAQISQRLTPGFQIPPETARLRSILAILTLVVVAIGAAVAFLQPGHAQIGDEKTGSEIIIGNVLAPSSDGSAAITIKVAEAYFKKINDHGGIAGHALKLVSYDPHDSLKRTLDLTRKLVEEDKAAVLYQMNPGAIDAIGPYVRYKKISQILDFDHAANTTIGSGIPALLQGRLLAKTINERMPESTISIVNENSKFSNEVLAGLATALYEWNASSRIANQLDVSEFTADTAALLNQHNDVLVAVGSIEFQRRILKQLNNIKFWPIVFMNDTALSIPADELRTSAEVVSVTNRWVKSELDPKDKTDWESFRVNYLPDDQGPSDAALRGYRAARTLTKILKLCVYDLSPKCIMDEQWTIRLPYRLVTQATSFEGGVWFPIGADGPTWFSSLIWNKT